jgi:hypothetical protein
LTDPPPPKKKKVLLFIRNQTFVHEVEGIFSLIRRKQKNNTENAVAVKWAPEMGWANHKEIIWKATVIHLAVLSSHYLEENEKSQGAAGSLGVIAKRKILSLRGIKPRLSSL